MGLEVKNEVKMRKNINKKHMYKTLNEENRASYIFLSSHSQVYDL